MRNLAELQENLDNLFQELEQVQNMSEADACEHCGTDTKEEGIEGIQEEIEYYQDKVNELQAELDEEDREPDYGLDGAFSSWRQVNEMFV